MSILALGALVQVESSPITNPAAAVRKDQQSIARTPSEYELGGIQSSRLSRIEGSQTSHSAPAVTPAELESNPRSVGDDYTADLIPTQAGSSRTKWRLLSACFMNFANGLNDSAPGALIPLH